MRESEHIRLLLPVEPQDDCRDALHLIDALSPRAAVDLLRVYAYRPAEMDAYAPEMLFSVPAGPRLDAREKSAVDELTKTSCRAIADAGYRIEYDVVAGEPASEILADAEKWRADLIVVRKSSHLTPEAHIGRLTAALVDRSRVPLLTYRRVVEDFRVTKMLLVYDLSERSRAALEWATSLAETLNVELHLVHVEVERMWSRGGGDEVRARLEALAGEMRAAAPGLRDVVAHVERAKSMVQGAFAVRRRIGCDLAVISSHQHVASALLGSEDKRLVRESQVPALVVPEKCAVSAADFTTRLAAWR